MTKITRTIVPAHSKAKLESEPKQTVNKRGKSSPTVKKMTRRIAKQMSTPKRYFND